MTNEPQGGGAARPRGASSLLAEGWEEIPGADGFFGLLGPHWQKIEDGVCSLGVFIIDKHLNRNGVVHGGMLASLADTAMGLTARQRDMERWHATIQLDLHYISAAQAGEFLVAQCAVRRSTRSVSFVNADLFSDGRLVATAQGIWKVLDASPRRRGGTP